MKKITKLLTLSLLSFQLIACGSGNKSDSSNPIESSWNDESSIKLEEMSSSIAVGETYQIKVTSSGSFTYTSTNESVATVSSSGLITAVSEGEAAIKVSNDNDFVYFRISIGNTAGGQSTDKVSIYLPTTSLSLYIGEKYALNPKLMVEDKELEGATFEYVSSSLGVANVIDSVITACNSGTSTITITATKGNVTATTTIEVNVFETLTYLVPDFETRQVVSGSPLDLCFVLVQNSEMITYGISDPVYTVSDTNLAYVDNNQLFAIHKGYFTLNASVTFDGATYSCDVELTSKELYKVTYTVDGVKIHEEDVISGDYIAYDVTPTKKDCVFKCWANGDVTITNETPINEPLNLTAKWLAYSDDVNSELTTLLWDYATGTEITVDNGGGTFLWEDYRFPDTHINVLLVAKRSEISNIIMPKFEYALFPAVSFYFIMQFREAKFVYGNYTSPTVNEFARCQVSIVGNKVYFNGVNTGETVSNEVYNAAESFAFKIKCPANIGGRLFVTGFYAHLSEI